MTAPRLDPLLAVESTPVDVAGSAIRGVPPDSGVPAPLERHYRVKSASAIIEQSEPWFRREIKAGRIRVVRIRSTGDPKRWSVRIPESEIRKLLIGVTR